MGKTYKVIGTLYIINSNQHEAREYLMRSHAIFESKGMLKLLKEVKSKLKMLNSSVKMAAEMAAQEALEGSGADDSGRDSPERKTKKKVTVGGIIPGGAAAAKKKKNVKKTVFRNNFVKESDSAS